MLLAQLPLPEKAWHGVARTLKSALGDVRFHRHEAAFATYGLPAYQADADGAEYRAEARRCSPRLLRAMPALYATVVRSLEAIFRQPVRFHTELAVPGFHFFPPSALEDFHGGSIHSDLSWRRVPWEFQQAMPTAHWSVLAVVEAPDGGAHLDFFDDYADPARGYFPSGAGLEDKAPASRLTMETGTLSVFNGYQLHRIGATDGAGPGRGRVTLQGHLYCTDGELIFYW